MAPKKNAKTAAAKGRTEAEEAATPKVQKSTPGKRGAAKAGEEATPPPTKRAKAAEEKGNTAKEEKKEKPNKPDKNAPLKRSLTPREELPSGGARILKILSVNVAGLRAVLNGDKAATLKQLVESEAPDVLCLNEHKLKEEDVEDSEAKLRELLPKEYSVMHWTCSTAKKGYSGVAVIFRETADKESAAIRAPVDVLVKKGMGEIGKKDSVIEEEGRILTAELPELFLVAAYVPNSGMTLGRLGYRTDRQAETCWDRAMTEYLKHLQDERKKPVVLIGDLNCGHRVQDIWNMYERPDFPEGLAEKPLPEQYTGLSAVKKSAGLTPEERDSFPKLLQEADLVDTFRARHPSAQGVFSYFSQRVVQNRPMNRGLRLDYALASSSLCTALKPASQESLDSADEGEAPSLRVLDSFILDERDLVADHAAIGCTLVLPAADDAA